MAWRPGQTKMDAWAQGKVLHLMVRAKSAFNHYLPLLALGLALQILFVGIYSTASELNWYPSRLGPPSEWLDQHVYTIVRSLFPTVEGLHSLAPLAAYFVALTAIFGLYIVAIWHAWHHGAGTRAAFYIVLGFSCVFAFSSLLQPYLSSQDIFSYAFYGHISALYGGNPYTAVPRDFPFDPLFSAIFWKDQPSNYGPLWTYLVALITLVTGTNSALTLIGIKLVVTGFAIGTVPLVWHVLRRTAPSIRLAGTLLYAWNPLVIMETAGSGHNDAVVGFFVLLGFFLYTRNAKLGGIGALFLSVLTKYVTVVLLPLYLFLWLRDCPGTRERYLALCKLIGATIGFLVVSYVSANAGQATIQIASFGTNPSAYVNSPLELAFREIRVFMGDSRDVASLPLRYRVWWVTTTAPTLLQSRPDTSDTASIGIPTSTPLMVVEPPRGSWLHVYAPRLDQFGYVRDAATAQTPAPAFAGAVGTATALAQIASQGTNSHRANLVLRAITGALFLLLFARLVRETQTYAGLIYASLSVLFASYWLLQTWFWPWYLNWALPLAALVPHRRMAALMVAFSLTALGLHAHTDIAPLPFVDAFYEYRSLAIFGLPVLLVGAYLAFFRLQSTNTLKRVVRSGARPRYVLGSAAALVVLIAAGFTGIIALDGNRPQATATADEEATERSLDWIEYYWRGTEFFEKNRYPEAIASLTNAIEARPDFVDAYRLRFEALLRMRKFDEAIEDISRLLAYESDKLDLLLVRGSIYQQTQRYQMALQDFGAAISIDATDPRAHRYRAQTLHEIGLVNEAIAGQQKALALSPHSAVLYRELAAMHATLGNMGGALALYDAAISLDKYDVESYVGRASVLRILGRGEETIPDLREVLVLSNDEDLRTWARRTMASVSRTDSVTPDFDQRQ